MTWLLVLLVGVLFGGLQSGVLAQDGGKVSYPRALERLESLVASLNESLHETKEDLQEVRLCLNQTKKVLGEVQGESEVLRMKNNRLETQLAETRNELAATKTLHQLAIDELRASQGSSRVEALERQGSELVKELKRVRKNVSDLEDEQLSERISAIESEQLPRQLTDLNTDFTELTKDLRRLEDENLPRRVSSLALQLLTAEFRHNFTTTRLKEEQRQIRSEVQMLETELESALTAQDEQVANMVQELTDKQNSLELKLDEVVIGEAEWDSRIASSIVVEEVRVSVRVLDAALSNMTAVMGKGLSEAKANFGALKSEVEVVENKLCEKVHNLTIIVEDAKESLEQNISAIEKDIARSSALAAEQQRSIDRLTTQVTRQGQSVNQLNDSVTDQEERFDNLTRTVEEQGNCIKRLKDDVQQIKMGGSNGSSVPPGTVQDVWKLCKGTSKTNPASSCEKIYQCNPTAPSGHYWINIGAGVATQVFCMMNTTDCSNITGGWMRAAYINMTDAANSCPVGLITYTQSSTRFCGTSLSSYGCTSVNFPTYGVPFTKVCGRALGYQYGSTDAFHTFSSSIESRYVDGLSVTHGTPRNHIWTFATGVSKGYTCCKCPCASPYPGRAAPSFVGEDYFCESGNTGRWTTLQWYLDDPLWDSQGCASGSTCCDRGGPWFTTTLSQEMSDDVEVRWCTDQTGEEVGVEQLEIYIN